MSRTLTSLAFYLPQFHRIPENDEWWGEGFTEWTCLNNSKGTFRRAAVRRPVPPLGEYSLEDPATMELQWKMASSHGIDGFAVWDYWFGDGRQLLQRPIEMVLREDLDFKYCFAWANHSWYDKSRNRLLCKQEYLGADDYKRYFDRSVEHFLTGNYVKIDGRPVFIIFNPYEIPDFSGFIAQWHALARSHGFPGMYFVADRLWEDDQRIEGLQKYSNSFRFLTRRNKLLVNYLKELLPLKISGSFGPKRYDFRRLERDLIPTGAGSKFVPSVITGWNTTPRHGSRGVIFDDLDVAAFKRQLVLAARHFLDSDAPHNMLFVKSWNEWAEGNVLEPDSIYGYRFLEAFREFATETRARLEKEVPRKLAALREG